MEQERLLNVQELAMVLGVKPSWVYSRSRVKGSGWPVIRVGKYCKYRLKTVLEHLQKQQQEAGAQ